MTDWKYHDEDEERRSRWGQAPDFTIQSPESGKADVPTVSDGFDASVTDLLGRIS